MSAAHLELTWNNQDELESQPVTLTWKPRTQAGPRDRPAGRARQMPGVRLDCL